MKTKPKPRLSMKLLWKIFIDFQKTGLNDRAIVFLEYLEQQMKPLKP